MRNIHQLFIEADQEIIRRATNECGRESLCWYPSASTDFRHIGMLEEEGLNHSGKPSLVYIHTDVRLPMNECDESDGKNQRMLAANDWLGERIKILRVIEIHPKKIIREFSEGVCSFDADENAGKVFLMELEMEAICHGRLVRVPIPVLYFISENLAFLVHAFLHHQISVNTLIHIKDGGGSFGGSRIPMNFIYQVAHILRLKRVVCDETPVGKEFNTAEDYHVLMKEIVKCGHINHEQIREVSENDILAVWKDKRIERGKIPRNGYTPTKDGYYDWRKV